MDITLYRPLTVNDQPANGGTRSGIPIYNEQRNNLLPDISRDDVNTGLERYRKFFFLPDSPLLFLRAYLKHPSLAMDEVLIHAGTATDTQAEASLYTGWKGSGVLKTALTSGGISEIVVTSENEGQGFNPMDLICLSGSEGDELVRISTVTWNGLEATLGLSETIANNYAAGAYISAVIERGSGSEYGFWIKEIIPRDITSYISNISRINFLSRSA